MSDGSARTILRSRFITDRADVNAAAAFRVPRATPRTMTVRPRGRPQRRRFRLVQSLCLNHAADRRAAVGPRELAVLRRKRQRRGRPDPEGRLTGFAAENGGRSGIPGHGRDVRQLPHWIRAFPALRWRGCCGHSDHPPTLSPGRWKICSILTTSAGRYCLRISIDAVQCPVACGSIHCRMCGSQNSTGRNSFASYASANKSQSSQ
jgi:hypothetical protein